MANPKNIIAIVLALSVIFLTGCSVPELEEDGQEYDVIDDAYTGEEQVTGNVVATVNDEEITSEDVEEVQQSLLQQGQQVSEEDALEEVISQKLLEQKVQLEGITVTDQDAESMIEQQLTLQGATLDDYKEQLESMGLSYESELENIKKQLATQEYLDGQLEDQVFDVTEEEAQEFYEMYKSQSPEEVPPYEEIEEQLIATIEQEKQQEAITDIIQRLREDANVEYK